MPFNRPTLTELREQNQGYIETQLESVGKLLRFSNMRVLSDVISGMSHLHYGYLDYIARQAVPITAVDEYLAAWGSLVRVYRKPAGPALCTQVRFTGLDGATIDAGAILKRSDGYQYTLDVKVTIENGEAIGSITAVLPDPQEDTTGGGAKGNAAAGTTLVLDTTWTGIDSTAVMVVAATGGTDIEDEESFRNRILLAYRNTPQGGSKADYIKWALEVPGVTRAWTVGRLVGPGTVGVYIMADGSGDGFPTGDDGVSSKETWGAQKATGMQGEVADYIYDVQPVTALVFVCSPVKKEVDFEIKGLSEATEETKQKILSAINEVFFDVDELDGSSVILLSELNYAISNVTGTTGYILAEPAGNITLNVGELPAIGEVTYAQ